MMAYEAMIPVEDANGAMMPVNALPRRPLW